MGIEQGITNGKETLTNLYTLLNISEQIEIFF